MEKGKNNGNDKELDVENDYYDMNDPANSVKQFVQPYEVPENDGGVYSGVLPFEMPVQLENPKKRRKVYAAQNVTVQMTMTQLIDADAQADPSYSLAVNALMFSRQLEGKNRFNYVVKMMKLLMETYEEFK